jgi:hypothetical protein
MNPLLHSRREMLLATAVAVLLIIVLAVQLLDGDKAGPAVERIALRAWLRQADRLEALAASVRPDLERVLRQARAPGPGVENELRRHLESLAGEAVSVRSSRRISESALEGTAPWRIMTYELQLQGTLEGLQDVLRRIDASDGLLRVDNLQVIRISPESPLLNARVTVSALLVAPDARKPSMQ